jgi:tetratricopeptide (TPR) repeat protein
MIAIKLPSALAEPEQMQYVSLLLTEATMQGEDEDRQDLRRDKWQAAIRAARLNPHNSKFLETAGLTYLERFNTSHSENENSIPLGQLRDAIKASEFESPEAMHEWLDRAVGKNIKLLRLAKKYLRQSLKESPLRAHAYLELVELGFLDSISVEAEDAYLKQALTLRPHDPSVLFAIGRHISLSEDLDSAMPYWSKAFSVSPETRRKVTGLLAPQISAADFLAKLNPEWTSLPDIARAFDQAGRQEEGRQIWQKCLDDSRSQSKVGKSRAERDQVLLTLCDAYTALEQSDRALAMLAKAHRQSPDNMQIRIRLAWGLYHAQRYSDAADHLIWLSSRLPGDKSIQDAAAKATKERMRTAGGADSPS